MRVFHIQGFSVAETDTLPEALPAQGFVWMALGRREFELLQTEVQQCLHALCGAQLVDLHISDLLNKQLPSHYDYTGQYDVLVFRRLAQGRSETNLTEPGQPLHQSQRRGGPPVLRRIDTSPVGFALFDQMLVTSTLPTARCARPTPRVCWVPQKPTTARCVPTMRWSLHPWPTTAARLLCALTPAWTRVPPPHA